MLAKSEKADYLNVVHGSLATFVLLRGSSWVIYILLLLQKVKEQSVKVFLSLSVK